MSQFYPILPLRDIVVFPQMIVTLFVGRERSVNAIAKVLEEEKEILLLTQKDAEANDPEPDALYPVGTLAKILQYIRLPDDTVKVLVEGVERVAVENIVDTDDCYLAQTASPEEVFVENEEHKALVDSVRKELEGYAKLNRKISAEVLSSISRIEDPSKLSDVISAHVNVAIEEKQALLSQFNINERLEALLGFMGAELSILRMEKRIRGRVKRQMEKSQREYYLNEQMKAIQKELGDSSGGGKDDFALLEERIAKTKFTEEALEKVQAELKKLRSMPPMSAEATVVRNYLDWMLDIPWDEGSEISHDLGAAQEILDKDHYGLEKVKERIVEYLAVQKRTKKLKGPILCLVGPPGVGKTSLGQSIANATGRAFVRMSLGGVRDESEIRGHRRTYIGSMPGRVIQGMKKAKRSNPLFLLDEVDKLASDWRGDPSSALLEVLDPAQNSSFNDHYLEVDYDLSDVMFITTANSLNMPRPLLDRMEIIRLSGYTEDEKLVICQRHLVPKALVDHGLKPKEVKISDAAVRDIIRYYTREAGVRNLEREIAKIARKVVKRIEAEGVKSVSVSPRSLDMFLGVRKYSFGSSEKEDLIGTVTGLAYTEFGGDLLQIEAVRVPGKGRVVMTGSLGDVMKESVQTAESFIKSRAPRFGIRPTIFEKNDIHVHVPEGATPKDGPSAGIAMVTTMVSLLTQIPVRRDVAMTGEVTLRGRVLPIGGLKEKLLSALRGGIRTVLIPHENKKDLAEIPDNVKEGLEIICVKTVEQVLKHTLTKRLTPIDWDDALTASEPLKKSASQDVSHTSLQ